MKDCIFCKIIENKSKSWKVYEDDLVVAFFDVYPSVEGHTLVVPKKHFENIYDITEDYLQRVITVCKKLALHYKKSLGIKAINLIHGSGKEAQQDVFHFHMHIIPRKDSKRDNFKMSYKPVHKKISSEFDIILKKIREHPDFKNLKQN